MDACPRYPSYKGPAQPLPQLAEEASGTPANAQQDDESASPDVMLVDSTTTLPASKAAGATKQPSSNLQPTSPAPASSSALPAAPVCLTPASTPQPHYFALSASAPDDYAFLGRPAASNTKNDSSSTSCLLERPFRVYNTARPAIVGRVGYSKGPPKCFDFASQEPLPLVGLRGHELGGCSQYPKFRQAQGSCWLLYTSFTCGNLTGPR